MGLDTANNFCANAFPVYLDGGEHLNDSNARKVQIMDLYGIDKCGWK